jgi:3-oxoacyl-[acyl-carrier-protein] synthase-3
MRKEPVTNKEVYPIMNGNFVFKHAVTRFPETMMEALNKAGKTIEDLDMFIPHQANLRIAQFVQQNSDYRMRKSLTIFRNTEIQRLLLFPLL